MSPPVASSRSFWFTPIAITVFAALLLYLLVLSTAHLGSTPYVQLETLLTFGFVGGALLGCFVILYNWPMAIHVFPDRIEKRMIGRRRVFYWREVDWISFRPTRSKYGTIETCKVVSRRREIAFNQYTRNFSALRNAVEHYRGAHFIRLDNQRKFSPAEQRLLAWADGIYIVLLLGLMLMMLKKPIENTGALKTLYLTLAEPVTVLRQSKTNSPYGFALKSREYPAFEFRIKEEQYIRTDVGVLQISTGEHLEIQVSEDIFLKKIARSKAPGFWEKHVHWSQIGVYGIVYKGQNLIPKQVE